MKNTYIKSPLNYTGGKYKLLPQLDELFPQNYETFVDLFTGGANVVANIKAKQLIAFDINHHVISLFTYLKNHSYEAIITKMEEIISYYQLSDSTTHGYEYYGCNSSKGLGSYNKENYTKLRKDYNQKTTDFPEELLFFTLIIFGFNNQIRFNKNGYFNMPVGKRDFNKNVRKNLNEFMETIHQNPVHFHTNDFRNLDIESLKEGDFVYADPPYLITTATYNEQNGWTEKDEHELLALLDELHKRNVKFALSNIIQKGELINLPLVEWCQKYTIHRLDFHYKNANYQKKGKENIEREVLITNY